MLYAILGRDAPDALPRRRAARPAHLLRIEELLGAGRLLTAGPLPAIDAPDPGPAGNPGSPVVAEFESLAAAQAWVAADPYVTEGVFAGFEVHPFVQSRP
jgi:uncharacterized protein YciI